MSQTRFNPRFDTRTVEPSPAGLLLNLHGLLRPQAQ